jgi:hypothetical protein
VHAAQLTPQQPTDKTTMRAVFTKYLSEAHDAYQAHVIIIIIKLPN